MLNATFDFLLRKPPICVRLALAEGPGSPCAPLGPARLAESRACRGEAPGRSLQEQAQRPGALPRFAFRLPAQAGCGATSHLLLDGVSHQAGPHHDVVGRHALQAQRFERALLEQVAHQLEAAPAAVLGQRVNHKVNRLSFPLCFLDFETFQPAIPAFDGVKPYQQIPTQHSLHVLHAPDGELEHYEFLAEAGLDPRRAVAEHLVADILAQIDEDGIWSVAGTTLAYNMGFEKGRIKEMVDAFPDLAGRLLAINEGMDDLIKLFNGGGYYARAMGGSNSIKYVLSALFPGDPELDYHSLEGVHNGSEAMSVYAGMVNMGLEELAQTRENLLRYCELDTYVMVKIWQKLTESVGEIEGIDR